MAKPTMTMTLSRVGHRQILSPRVLLYRRMQHRLAVAMLERPDDLLLHRQPAGDRVEFDPALEGKAVEELPMLETGLDRHRARLRSLTMVACLSARAAI
ncbi:hypothetical protein [Agrobacterium tumefaciens]|uniref:hypothetical protein n=1 Tax=Agrobacterium tumefaciens TaxID=358 RepID=UPI002202D0B4|nr:hypothetical protein FY131_27730 [Agrobacterium tumefaciens]